MNHTSYGYPCFAKKHIHLQLQKQKEVFFSENVEKGKDLPHLQLCFPSCSLMVSPLQPFLPSHTFNCLSTKHERDKNCCFLEHFHGSVLHIGISYKSISGTNASWMKITKEMKQCTNCTQQPSLGLILICSCYVDARVLLFIQFLCQIKCALLDLKK